MPSFKKSLPLLTLSLVAAAGAIVACSGITGVGDLKLVDCAEGEFDCVTQPDASPDPTSTSPTPTQTATNKPRTDSGPSVNTDASINTDASTEDVVVLPKPTYCDYTVVASFEDTPNSGAGAVPVGPAPTYEAGRYGKAGRLSQPLFYPVTNGVQYKATVGSVSFWMKPGFTIPDNNKRVFFRPKQAAGEGTTVTGYGVISDNSDVRMEFDGLGNSTEVPHNQLLGWANTEWVHFVGTWSRDNPREQSLYVRTPGMTAHKKATDGDVYNAGTNTQFLRLGVEEQPATEAYDDFAVWARILTDAEVAEIYSSPQSIRQRCEGPNIK
jgi:hypothetical protein